MRNTFFALALLVASQAAAMPKGGAMVCRGPDYRLRFVWLAGDAVYDLQTGVLIAARKPAHWQCDAARFAP
jgi:hypothetical protein